MDIKEGRNPTLPPDGVVHDLPTAIYIDSQKMGPNWLQCFNEVEYLMQQPTLPADYYISVKR